MNKLQLELLTSENRFLSINVLVPRPRVLAAYVNAELDAVFDVQRRAGAGFVRAIWYGSALIAEFVTCAQRDRALSSIIEDPSPLVKKNVGSIGSGEAGEPELYMSWVLPFYREDTPAALSSALEDHFDGTGYSSFFTFGQFDRPEGYIRIIFHNAPPALKTILKSHCFQERWFWIESVTESDYPLQKPSVIQKEIKANADIGVAKELANDNDTERESMGLAVEISDEEAAHFLQTEQAPNGSGSTVPPTIPAKPEVNADIQAAEGPANDTGKKVELSPADHSAIETEVNADVDATENQANDSDKKAEASAAADSGIETEVNANVDIAENQANDTDNRAEASPAEDSSIEILTPSHLGIASSGDNSAMEEQTQSSEEEVETDDRAVSEATTAVLVDDTSYNIPTASALPLHEAKFNTFTRMYLEYGREEPEKMDCKTLIKLYRTFLETHFPGVEGKAKMDAFQRVSC